MQTIKHFALSVLILASVAATTGCVVAEPRSGYAHESRDEPRDGYWDREHHRYYHEHSWRECTERGEYCRD